MRTKYLFVTTFSLLILFAWTTRLYHIDSQSIWFDEGWSAYAAVQPTLRDAVEADPTNYIAFANLGNERRANGDPAGGLLAYRMARRGDPSLVTNRSNVLLGMLSAEDTTAHTLRGGDGGGSAQGPSLGDSDH